MHKCTVKIVCIAHTLAVKKASNMVKISLNISSGVTGIPKHVHVKSVVRCSKHPWIHGHTDLDSTAMQLIWYLATRLNRHQNNSLPKTSRRQHLRRRKKNLPQKVKVDLQCLLPEWLLWCLSETVSKITVMFISLLGHRSGGYKFKTNFLN